MGEHITISNDRRIYVPESLKKIAVQYDHNATTATFDCPRYWDGHDLSKMAIYVNYIRSDEFLGSCLCTNMLIDSSDSDLIHFDWTVSGNVTEVAGPIQFLICVKKTDSSGKDIIHWSSELNDEMYVSSGLKCREVIIRRYADIISQILSKIGGLEDSGIVLAVDNALNSTSKNPVQNKVVAAKFSELQRTISEIQNEFDSMANGIAMVDRATGTRYTIYVSDGKLIMEESGV